MMASMNSKTASSMEVTIDDSICSMTNGVHWAHIKCVGDGPMENPIPITLLFADYTAKVSLLRSSLDKKYDQETREWTVMFGA